MVTDTEDDQSTSDHQIITIDDDSELNLEDLEGDWGKVMFLDSRHDLTAAWESNRMFLE